MIQRRKQSVFCKNKAPFWAVFASTRSNPEPGVATPGLSQDSAFCKDGAKSSVRCASRGFTPTPTLSPFRFLKSASVGMFTLAHEFTTMRNHGETKKLRQGWCRGFTLVELMVTLGIFAILTAVVLSNYRGYGTNMLFANASEDVILALRQAQIYGVGVKGDNSLFDMPYGVYVSTAAGTKNQVLVFSDANSNRIYDPSLNETIIEKVSWLSNISITSLLCDGVLCGSNAYVTFRRPSADAFIANTANQAATFGTLVITVQDSTTGKTSTIKVTSAGQISLK